MTNLLTIELQKLSKYEKISLAQTLWEEIASETDLVNIPKEHIEILNQRLGKIDSNLSNFRNWNEVKLKYGGI